MKIFSHRSGVTLMELVLFIAILAIAMMFVIPFLFFAEENNLRQQSQSLVQQAGAEALQGIGRRLRDAERIRYPPLASRLGEVLILQSSVSATDPMVIALSGSSLIVIEGTLETVLSSPQVHVQNLSVTNTSVSAERQSVHIRFEVQHTLDLAQTGSTFRTFETTYTLFPDDEISAGCGCTVFTCSALNTVQWGTCSPTCTLRQATVTCTP